MQRNAHPLETDRAVNENGSPGVREASRAYARYLGRSHIK